MERIRRTLVRFLLPISDDRGAIATEYGLTLMLISLAIIVAAAAFGVAVSDLFDRGTAGIPPVP